MADTPRPEDPFQAALRRAILRAEEVRDGLPTVPPRMRFELRRKALHVFAAVVAVPVLLLMPLPVGLTIAVGVIVLITSTWLVERWRMQSVLLQPYKDLVHEPVATALEKTRRPGEDFPWSPVLYTVSLLILALSHAFLGLSWTIAFAAYAILGLGDAASALVGVAYGRRKLPWNRRKSLEGLLAGLAAGYLGGIVMSAIPFAFAGLHMPPIFFVVVLVGAAAGALSESLPGVEDNFVVPLTSAGAMFALTSFLQLPLP